MLVSSWTRALLLFVPIFPVLALTQEKPTADAQARSRNRRSEAIRYNLLPRYRKGDTARFSFELRMSRFGSGGTPEGENYVKGYFTQKVMDVRPDGAPVFHFVRDNTAFAISDASGKELIAQKLTFGDGFSYDVCFEDDFDVFPVQAPAWPRDLAGFMMFESVYVSHQFFHTILTRQHGGLDRLTHPGMRVIMPDSDKHGVVGLPPQTRIEVHRGTSTLEFLGIGDYKGHKAAILWFDVLYEIAIPIMSNQTMDARGREFLRGFIWVSPDNGELLGGKLLGSNLVALPGPDGKLRTNDVMITGVLDGVAP